MKAQKTMIAMENGREQHTRKNTTYQWELEQESETKCKRECVREKMTTWARENCEETVRTRVKMRQGDKKCKSKHSVGEHKNKGLLRWLSLNNRRNRIQHRFWGPTDVVSKP